MLKMKSLLLTIFLLLIFSVSAMAFSFQNEPSDNWREFSFDGYETFNVDTDPGSGDYRNGNYLGDSWGILKLDSIKDGNDQVLWSDGNDGQSIRGMFYGLDITEITGDGKVLSTQYGNNPARLDMYLVDQAGNDWSLSGDTATVGQGTAGVSWTAGDERPTYEGVTNGDKFLSTNFVPGYRDDDTTLVEGTTQSLEGDGTAFSYMDLIQGWGLYNELTTDVFLTNNGSYADLFSKNSYTGTNKSDWDAKFDDPVVGAVPEPTTLLLFGTGLLGLAAFGRKKFMRKG